MLWLNFLFSLCVGAISWFFTGRFLAGVVLALAWMIAAWVLRKKKAVKG